MDFTGMLLFSLFFSLFSYFMVIARTRRQVLSLALAGVLVAVLVAPPPAQAQSLWGSINSVLNVINGAIKNALNTIQTIQTSIRDFYQKFTWPITLINQAKALVTQMVNQYRALMQSIFDLDLRSATLPAPKALEDIVRNLAPARALGMTTVWLNNGSEGGHFDAHPDFIDFEISDLAEFLKHILGVDT